MIRKTLPVVAVASLGLTAAGQPVTLVNHTAEKGFSAWHDPGTCIQLGRAQFTGGLAVGDFNRDGYPDLFCLMGGTTPDRLYINVGAGVFFLDWADSFGVDVAECGSGISVADYNDDGWLDVHITSYGVGGEAGAPGMCRLYKNIDGTSFVDVAAEAGVQFTSPTVPEGFGSAWGDYDLDGDLDLIVSTHTTAFGDPVESNGNRLYRNDGGVFTDVTDFALGAENIDGVRGYQPAFQDMDGDLYPELLFAADFLTARYFINNGDGTFTNYTNESGTSTVANGMGQCVADFNHDGIYDWYVTSIHLEGPYSGGVPGTGNKLYQGLGNHQYQDVSLTSNVHDGGWGWGTLAVDLDHDGFQEILEVNGWPQNIYWLGERSKLFYNNGPGQPLTEMAVAGGFDSVYQGRGLVYFDVELDGDLDIAVGNYNGPFQFFENQTNGGNWLRITLDTVDNPLLPPDGFNTNVVATANGMTQMRYLNGSPSYVATSELALHFGFGSAETVDELRFEWSRGQVTYLYDVPVNQALHVSGPRLGDIDVDGTIGIGDFLALLAFWGTVDDKSKMPADLNADGEIGIEDFLYILANWD